MWRRLWAWWTGDSVADQAEAFATGHDAPRFLYTPQMLAEINEGQRYQILSNRSQTEVYVVDTLHRQRVAQLYDISYALLVADHLNEQTRGEE